MRRAVTMAVVAVVLGGMALVDMVPAEACSLPPPPRPTEQELLSQADLVFEGVAVSRHDPNAGAPTQSSGDPIIWTFAVDREVKGTASQLQEVSSARSGATCGITFQIGTRYRVFADVVDGVFWTSLGSGTREAPVESSTTTTTIPTTTTTTNSTTTTTRPPTTTTTTVGPAQPTKGRTLALTG